MPRNKERRERHLAQIAARQKAYDDDRNDIVYAVMDPKKRGGIPVRNNKHAGAPVLLSLEGAETLYKDQYAVQVRINLEKDTYKDDKGCLRLFRRPMQLRSEASEVNNDENS